jgi:hypothetical protein
VVVFFDAPQTRPIAGMMLPLRADDMQRSRSDDICRAAGANCATPC